MKSLLILSLAALVSAGCSSSTESASEPPVVQPGHEAKAKDPVCGMMCNPKTARRFQHEGKIYYFCSEECLDKFKYAPESFVLL